ncbi:MAG: hypothetical protein KGZ58_00240 [Ignavibacteriales bacterium]|nr:hypothetical protein [Ignavibacteriales bacterium]
MNFQQALMEEVRELPEEAFPNLLKIVHLFKESILVQQNQATITLREEFGQWGRLSDEALTGFEKSLS